MGVPYAFCSSYHRLVSTLSWGDDLCSLSDFPSLGPSLLNTREFQLTLTNSREKKNRLFKAVVTPQANRFLLRRNPWIGNFRGSLIMEGVEAKIILVKSAEV